MVLLHPCVLLTSVVSYSAVSYRSFSTLFATLVHLSVLQVVCIFTWASVVLPQQSSNTPLHRHNNIIPFWFTKNSWPTLLQLTQQLRRQTWPHRSRHLLLWLVWITDEHAGRKHITYRPWNSCGSQYTCTGRGFRYDIAPCTIDTTGTSSLLALDFSFERMRVEKQF